MAFIYSFITYISIYSFDRKLKKKLLKKIVRFERVTFSIPIAHPVCSTTLVTFCSYELYNM